MTPTAIRRLRRVTGMTQADFAELLGTHANTVQQWEAEPQKAAPTGHHARSLVMLSELAERAQPRHWLHAAMTVTFWDQLRPILRRDPATAFALCWREWLELPGVGGGR